MLRGLGCASVWVASTCSTSLVPMPNASAPNAPCVAVCESPQTIVMPGWVTPSSGPDDVDDPAPVRAERVERDAELGAVALERLDLHARELVADARGDRRAVGRHVVVGGRERAVGPADAAALEPQPVERLRARHLVHQVQVDVEQVRRHLVGGPDLVEQRGCAHERRSPADTIASRTASSSPRFSKWCGRSASKVTQSPAPSACAAPSISSSQRAALDDRGLARARLVHRRVAGPAGRGAGRERVARDLGALAGQRRREHLVAVAAGAARAALVRGARC